MSAISNNANDFMINNGWTDIEVEDQNPSVQSGNVERKQPDPQAEKAVEAKLNEGTMDKTDLISGSKVTNPKVMSDIAKGGNQYYTKRSTGVAIASFFGRALIGVAHAIKSIVSFDFLRPSWWRNNVGNYSRKLDQTQFKQLAELPPLSNDDVVDFDFNLVATATGFKVKTKNVVDGGQTSVESTNVTFKPFAKNQSLYPGGHPRLSDIKQNPDLQDCFFLSSITALLSSKGPDAITRLIERNEKGDGWIVRMGDKRYNVPNGDVLCNGKSCVSDSAPWVKILEQAAAMHFGNNRSDMIYGVTASALTLLQGHSTNGAGPVTTLSRNYITLENLKAFKNNGIPIVIGHVQSVATVGVKNFLAGALRDNISPKHAITLLDIQDRGDNKAWLTVMDPYGRTRIISSSALERCEVTIGVDSQRAEEVLRMYKD